MILNDIWQQTLFFEILKKQELTPIDILFFNLLGLVLLVAIVSFKRVFEYPFFPEKGTLFESLNIDRNKQHYPSGFSYLIWGLIFLGIIIKPLFYLIILGVIIIFLLGFFDFLRKLKW